MQIIGPWTYFEANYGAGNPNPYLMYLYDPSLAGTRDPFHDTEVTATNESITTLMDAGMVLHGTFSDLYYTLSNGSQYSPQHLYSNAYIWDGKEDTWGNQFGVCPPYDQWAGWWSGHLDSYATDFGGGGCYMYGPDMD